jgi:hypothetical protein
VVELQEAPLLATPALFVHVAAARLVAFPDCAPYFGGDVARLLIGSVFSRPRLGGRGNAALLLASDEKVECLLEQPREIIPAHVVTRQLACLVDLLGEFRARRELDLVARG